VGHFCVCPISKRKAFVESITWIYKH